MHNLLEFLRKYNFFFVFILLEVISFGLLFRFNYYQQGIFFSSANVVVGQIYEMASGVTSYFHLRAANDALIERNVQLETEVQKLSEMLVAVQDSGKLVTNLPEVLDQYDMIRAHVVNNSINLPDNYLTLNKGFDDGVREDMGVVDGLGVVGIVYMTSSHYSVVISLLNSKFNLSCKIKGSRYFGYLRWEQGDSRYAYLRDLPRHAEFNLGDTVITSGHSAVFPEGLMVGTIDQIDDSNDGLSYLLKVKLSAVMGRVNNVRVLSRKGAAEQRELEENINRQ